MFESSAERKGFSSIAFFLMLLSVILAVLLGTHFKYPFWQIILIFVVSSVIFILTEFLVYLVIRSHLKLFGEAFSKKNKLKSLFFLMLANWAIYFFVKLILKQRIAEEIFIVILSAIGFGVLALLLGWKNKIEKKVILKI